MENPKYKNWKKYPDNPRINQLAEPKLMRRPYEPPKYDSSKRYIEILPLPPISTRLEQLSLSPVRCLLSACEQFQSVLPKDRIEKLNAQLQKSILTVYTRLANVQFPERK